MHPIVAFFAFLAFSTLAIAARPGRLITAELNGNCEMSERNVQSPSARDTKSALEVYDCSAAEQPVKRFLPYGQRLARALFSFTQQTTERQAAMALSEYPFEIVSDYLFPCTTINMKLVDWLVPNTTDPGAPPNKVSLTFLDGKLSFATWFPTNDLMFYRQWTKVEGGCPIS